MTEESPYTATLKADGGYDAPWMVVRADTIEQLDDRLSALSDGGVFASLGRAAASMKGQVTMGKQLGAEGTEPAKEPKPAAKKAPAKKAPAKAKPEPEPEEESAEETPAEEAPAEEAPTEEPKPAPKKAAPAKKSGGPPKPRWQ